MTEPRIPKDEPSLIVTQHGIFNLRHVESIIVEDPEEVHKIDGEDQWIVTFSMASGDKMNVRLSIEDWEALQEMILS